MVPIQGGILCASYIVGLAIAAFLATQDVAAPVGGYGLLGLGVLLFFTVPRFWRTGPKARLWLMAGLLGLLASLWWTWRLPHPGNNDISQWVQPPHPTFQAATVRGRIDTSPQLTRSDRVRFWLKADTFIPFNESASLESSGPSAQPQSVGGRVYVTLPQVPNWERYTVGQTVQVSGHLYQPKSAQNPGGFDFRAYLAQQGGFAGLAGKEIALLDQSQIPIGIRFEQQMNQLRQRIAMAQAQGLGDRAGPLVSAMVLGRRAVDLPYDLQDQFVQAGLAHTLAASGFHVSLLLSVVLGLTQSLGTRSRLGIGIGVLIGYVGLTGFQPSILRAALMGVGALIGLVAQRKVRRYGLLLIVVTLLLIFNPLWITNLGFQLSVLATLGLLVSVGPLTQKLDWMPPTLASLVAVPLAAFLWTLPLQLFAFGWISPYSLLLNIVATPFVIALTLGGMVSALASLLWPIAGSAIAMLLYYPAQGLIELVTLFNQLPGSRIAIGKILLGPTLAIYGLLALSWLQPWWQAKRWLAGLLALSIVMVPVGYAHATLLQATVLATSGDPALVIQDRTHVTVVSSGRSQTLQYNVLPFLQQQGVNQIDRAVTTQDQPAVRESWQWLQSQIPIHSLHTLPQVAAPKLQGSTASVSQSSSQPKHNLQRLSLNPPALTLQMQDQNWFIAPYLSRDLQEQLTQTGLKPAQVLYWYGNDLSEAFLNALQPQVAIASASEINPQVDQKLRDRGIQTYWPGQGGAVQWTPKQGFRLATSEIPETASDFD